MGTSQPLSLSALAIFRAVAREGGVVAAAASLHRVPSNVSTRLRQLEETVGAALFRRGRRGLTLTDEGRTLLRYAERMLALSDEAVDALRPERPAGPFRIGAMESTATSRLPRHLSAYHARYPDVELHIETETAGRLASRLKAGAVDAIFVAEPLTLEGAESEPVFEERLMLVLPGSFPDPATPRALDGATVVAFEEGCAYRRYLEEWLVEADVRPQGFLSVASYPAILACVAAGTGFAVVPRSVLDVISTAGEFRVVDLPSRYRRIRTLLAWRQDFRSPKLDALRALIAAGREAEAA